MEDLKQRIKELRNALRTAKKNSEFQHTRYETARDNESSIFFELGAAIQDCEHEWQYIALEGFRDEEGEYLDGECVVVTRICTVCGTREAHAFGDSKFERQISFDE